MTLFSSQLNHSLLLRPLMAWAFRPEAQFSQWFQQSYSLCALFNLFNAFSQRFINILPQRFANVFLALLTANLFLLAIASTFMETTHLGVLALSAGFLSVLQLLAKTHRPQVNALDASVALFFLSVLLSAAFSSYPHTTLEGLVKFTSYASGYLAFRTWFYYSPKHLKHYLWLLMALGVFQSLVGFYQNTHQVSALATWQDPSIDPQLQLTRVFGTLKPLNPNLLAGYLLPILGLATGQGIASALGNQCKTALVSLLGALIIFCGVVLSGSRGGYLALCVVAISAFMVSGHWLWHHPNLKQAVKLKAVWLLSACGISTIVFAAFSLHAGLKNRLLSIFSFENDSSNLYRITVWHSALKIAGHNLLWGIGPGNNTFKQVYGLYMVPGFNALGCYCVPLEVAVEQGVIGLLVFLLLLVTVLFRLCKALHDETDFLNLGILLGCLLGVIATVAYGAFDTVWYRPSVNLLFWSLLAASATLTERYLFCKPCA